MANAAPHLKKIPDALLGDELAYLGVVECVARIRRRRRMIQRDAHLFGDGNFLQTDRPENSGNRRRVVVREHYVGTRIHYLPRNRVWQTGRACQRLLCKRIAHY